MMDRRSSKLCPVAVGLFALIVVGCTKKPESYSLTDLRVDYRSWNCRDLADESDELVPIINYWRAGSMYGQ